MVVSVTVAVLVAVVVDTRLVVVVLVDVTVEAGYVTVMTEGVTIVWPTRVAAVDVSGESEAVLKRELKTVLVMI